MIKAPFHAPMPQFQLMPIVPISLLAACTDTSNVPVLDGAGGCRFDINSPAAINRQNHDIESIICQLLAREQDRFVFGGGSSRCVCVSIAVPHAPAPGFARLLLSVAPAVKISPGCCHNQRSDLFVSGTCLRHSFDLECGGHLAGFPYHSVKKGDIFSTM
jgi:hypothetical protein